MQLKYLLSAILFFILGWLGFLCPGTTRVGYGEFQAQWALERIHGSQEDYRSCYGRYAASLVQLGPPRDGRPNRNRADLIREEWAKGRTAGYALRIESTDNGYVLTATPDQFNVTGRRTFCSDQTGAIREFLNPTRK